LNTSAAVSVPLAEQAAIAFASDGPLARSDARLAQREVQQRLARAVALAIEQRSALVAEAGTGVGKTFAYLVPLLLSGRRALVSTATKNLQDQLFMRDLPGLCTALGLPVTLALLKGRSSYLCLQRLQQAFPASEAPIRTALVTARSAPAHERVIRTLRAWNIRIDESIFLGGLEKTEFLRAYQADVFFDDQPAHCASASPHIATGHVPHGIANA